MSSEITHNSVVHIGDYLRLRREELKLSIEKVSQKTKINLNILRALEANNFQALPSPAYIKGFVLSYARVVDLAPTDVTNKLEYSYLTIVGKPFPALNHTRLFQPASSEETTVVTSASSTNPTSPADILEQEQKIHARQKLVVPGLVFIGVCLTLTGLYQLVAKTIHNEVAVKEEKPYGPTFVPSSEILEMKKPVEEQRPLSTTSASPSAETPPMTGTTAAGSPPAATKQARRNFPSKEFRQITVRLFSVLPDAPENHDKDLLPNSVRDKLDRSVENVYIVATEGDTWLTYKLDDRPIQSVILEKGKNIFLQGKEVLVYLGNVRMTKVFYQSRLIDAPTKSGYKSLIFPESLTKNHQLPLFPKAADDILYTAEEYQRRMKLEEEELGAATSAP